MKVEVSLHWQSIVPRPKMVISVGQEAYAEVNHLVVAIMSLLIHQATDSQCPRCCWPRPKICLGKLPVIVQSSVTLVV